MFEQIKILGSLGGRDESKRSDRTSLGGNLYGARSSLALCKNIINDNFAQYSTPNKIKMFEHDVRKHKLMHAGNIFALLDSGGSSLGFAFPSLSHESNYSLSSANIDFMGKDIQDNFTEVQVFNRTIWFVIDLDGILYSNCIVRPKGSSISHIIEHADTPMTAEHFPKLTLSDQRPIMPLYDISHPDLIKVMSFLYGHSMGAMNKEMKKVGGLSPVFYIAASDGSKTTFLTLSGKPN